MGISFTYIQSLFISGITKLVGKLVANDLHTELAVAKVQYESEVQRLNDLIEHKDQLLLTQNATIAMLNETNTELNEQVEKILAGTIAKMDSASKLDAITKTEELP